MKKSGPWGLVVISVVVVAAIFGIWELVQQTFFPDADPATLHSVDILRGLAAAFLISYWSIWFLARYKERYEEKLKNTEEKFRAIIECVRDGVIFIDSNNKIALSNSTAEKIKMVKENIGKSVEACHPERVREDFIKRFNLLKPKGLSGKHPVFRCDGMTFENTFSSVKDSKGNVLGFVFVIRDITERLLIEQQIIQAEKLGGIGQLAAGVAHELNTPLASIAAYSEELVDRIKDAGDSGAKDPKKIIQYLDIIQKQAYRCKEITQSLLSLARKTEVNLKKADINCLIKETIELILSNAKKKNIEVVTQLETDLPEIITDRLKLQQVIFNVLANAFDAIDSQGTITVSTDMHDNRIYLTITDTGKGIEERDLARIFDPFFSTKYDGKGVGLGLSICHAILQELGGEMDVKSSLGKGTAMTVSLPVLS